MPAIVTFKHSGDFKKTTKFLNYVSGGDYIENVLKQYAEKGLHALQDATPVDTGKTRDSWSYVIEHTKDYVKIEWHNDNIAYPSNVPVVILITNGHATKDKGWVQGRDFISPVLQPIFDDIAEKVWREVVNA